MNIYFACEVDENNKPIYIDLIKAFMHSNKSECAYIVSTEYYSELESKENVRVLPENVINEMENNLENSSKRGIMLSVCRMPALEEYISGVVKDFSDGCVYLYTNGRYYSFSVLEEQEKFINYALVSGISDGDSNNTYYKKKIKELNERIEELKLQFFYKEQHVLSLTECLDSTANYLHELELHATNLDNELKKYDMDEIMDRMKKLEFDREKYLKLYTESINKINTITEENLILKKQGVRIK